MKDSAHVKSPLLQDFLKKQPVLISYLRDEFGYKRGIVVATSPTNIGFSTVNLSKDVDWQRVNPYSLPAVRKMIDEGEPIEKIAHSAAFNKCINRNNQIRIPLFVLRVGMLIALDRCLNQVVLVKETLGDPIIECPGLPHDTQLHKAILGMRERAKKYFK